MSSIFYCLRNGEIVITELGDADCIESSDGAKCSCAPEKQYCGHQIPGLTGSGHWHDLFDCAEPSSVRFKATCKNGCPSAHREGCACEWNRVYCGHELISDLFWSNMTVNSDSIYYCTEDGVVEEMSTRETECRS